MQLKKIRIINFDFWSLQMIYTSDKLKATKLSLKQFFLTVPPKQIIIC